MHACLRCDGLCYCDRDTQNIRSTPATCVHPCDDDSALRAEESDGDSRLDERYDNESLDGFLD